MSTGLAHYSTDLVKAKSKELKSRFYSLMLNPEFNDVITNGPNSTWKVKKRFAIANAMFQEVLGDYQA